MKDLPRALDRELPTLQIIIASLIGAVVLFMVTSVVLFPFFKGEVPDGKPVLISYVALGLTLLVLLSIRPLVLTAMARSATATTMADEAESESHLSKWFQRCTITEHAILEGIGFFNLTAYTIERQVWSLLITTTIILWMVFRFPKRDRAYRWIEDLTDVDNRS